MSNAGASPLNPSTPIGQVRLTLGDTQASPLAPEVSGQASYEWFSDAELAQFLLNSEGSVNRAVGYAIMQLATGAGLKAYAIKTDDLSMDATKRGASLLEIAQSYFAQARAEEAADVSGYFAVVDFGGYVTNHRAEGIGYGRGRL